MKVLFINSDGFFYNNSSTMQNLGILYGLKELGAEVDLLALQPQEEAVGFDLAMQNALGNCINRMYQIPLTSLYKKLNKEKRHVVENNGDENKWISALKGKIRRFIKNILVFDIRVLNLPNIDKVDIDLETYDIILSASDPKSTHCIANRLLKMHSFHGRYIQYWGDPLYLDITRDRSILDGLCKYLERETLKSASKIVYATPFTFKAQKKQYPQFGTRMSWAHQAAIFFDLEKKSPQKLSDEFSIVYCGDYRKETRNIIPLYDAIKNHPCHVKLDIYGTSNVHLTPTLNIRVHGQVTRNEADQAESNADVLVCICNLRGTQIPGKIYYLTNYLKPIIVIVDGEYKEELKDYFESMNRFIVCENNENAIEDAIRNAKTILNEKTAYKNSESEFSPLHMAENIIR